MGGEGGWGRGSFSGLVLFLGFFGTSNMASWASQSSRSSSSLLRLHGLLNLLLLAGRARVPIGGICCVSSRPCIESRLQSDLFGSAPKTSCLVCRSAASGDCFILSALSFYAALACCHSSPISSSSLSTLMFGDWDLFMCSVSIPCPRV